MNFAQWHVSLVGRLQNLVAGVTSHLVWLLRKLQVVHVLHQVLGVVASEVPMLPRGLIHYTILTTLNYSKLLWWRSRMRPIHGSTERLRLKVEAAVYTHTHILYLNDRL